MMTEDFELSGTQQQQPPPSEATPDESNRMEEDENVIPYPPPVDPPPPPQTSTSTDSLSSSALVDMKTVRLSDGMGRVGIYTGTVDATTHLPVHQGVMVYETDGRVAKFVGTWRKGGYYSEGQLTYRSGDVYHGKFDPDNLKHDVQGSYTFAEDGRSYRGNFVHDIRHGHGVMTWADGSIYQGGFVNNVRDGSAIYHAPGGIVYHGSFRHGVYHGYGEYQGHDRSVYRGSFEDGQPHGHGVMSNKNGDIVHEGEWEHGKPVNVDASISNHNTAKSKDKSVTRQPPKKQQELMKKVSVVHNQLWISTRGKALYRGLWNVNAACPTGNGTAEYDDSTIYEGCFDDVEGQWHGQGRWSSSNGDVYEGNFVHGERHGFGIYTWKDGRQYQGSFEHNVRQGSGVLVYANNDLYEGEFQQGQRHGQGTFTFSNGATYHGEWCNGLYHGHGKLVQNNGKTYEGQFRQGLAHGPGCEWDANGKVIFDGKWKRGEPVLLDTDDDLSEDGEGRQQEESVGDSRQHDVNNVVVNSMEAMRVTGTSNGPIAPPPASAPPPPPSADALPLSPPPIAPKSDSTASSPPQLQRSRTREYEKCQAVVDQALSDAQGNAGRYTGIVCLMPEEGVDNPKSTTKGKSSSSSSANWIMKPHGVGRMVYADGKRIHEGFWKQGNKEGHGRCLFFPQGDWHEGEYKNNKRHGPGRYHWKDGRLYEGHYENDYRHGQGTFSYPSKEVYLGSFVKGQRSGHGRFDFADGAGYYEGEWRVGKYHGNGKLVLRKSAIGSNPTDDLTKQLITYEGTFVSGQLHGFGTKTDLSTGQVESGHWIQGQLCAEPVPQTSTSDNESEMVANGTIKVAPPEDNSESNGDDHSAVEAPLPVEAQNGVHEVHRTPRDEPHSNVDEPVEVD